MRKEKVNKGIVKKPMAQLIADASGVNVNTIYALSKLLNEKVLKKA